MNYVRTALFALLLAGCSRSPAPAPQAQTPTPPQTITLATTTSTRDSGLLDALLPRFQEQTGIEVKVVAVGSGQSLALGRRGDADVLLTHAPDAEQQFMDEGYGELRLRVMYNDFVLVGPPADPAEVAAETAIVESLGKIANSESPFISRGDESGTHMKEKSIWQNAEIEPSGDWYIEAGAGMAAALRMAGEKQAYTLSDRGTFLALKDSLDLQILGEGDTLLFNPYTVMVVSSQKHPHVGQQAARQFADFLTSPDAQDAISRFGVDKYGQPLFFARSTSQTTE